MADQDLHYNCLRHYSVVEGPSPKDVEFFVRFGHMAELADDLLDELLQDSEFRRYVDRLLSRDNLFLYAATHFLVRCAESGGVFSIGLLNNEWSEMFAVMTQVGMFIRTGERYQIVVPTDLSREKVRRAMLALIATEDGAMLLHPEALAFNMPVEQSEIWEERLRSLPLQQRVADRNVLLED